MKKIGICLLALVFAVFVCEGRKKPLIGISSCFDEGYKVAVSQAYVYAVQKAGGIPVVLPLQRDSVAAAEMVGRLDALVMTGGEDLSPEYYGEQVWNGTVEVNPARDTSDMLILRLALKRRMPVLAICRGTQALAVCFGGRLYQDIPSQLDGTIGHSRGGLPEPLHKITIDRDSHLYRILGVDTLMVNSFHHQAACDGFSNLKVSAVAPDGVIEAVEWKNVLGLQFHPEKMIYEGDDTLLPIFENLVSEAAKF